jgi:hypothetical protein
MLPEAPWPALVLSRSPQPRLLFCSWHCSCDPSSGAALCTRELLELLAQRGWCCRVFCGPQLDFEQTPALAHLLAAQGIRFEQRQAATPAGPLSVFHFRHGGVPVQICAHPLAERGQPAKRTEGACFLALYERLLERFHPDLVLTYGGDGVAGQIIALAKRRNLPVVFARKRSQANCMVICGSVVVAGSACNSILDKRRAALG